MVLSVTLKDGTNVKYLIKPPQADILEAARKEGISKEKVSSWEMSQLRTAFNRYGLIPAARCDYLISSI